MAIYGRWGEVITIVRVGTLKDVQALDHRKPDKDDRAAVQAGSYVVAQPVDEQTERLYHLAFLRADDGSAEITRAIDNVRPPVSKVSITSARKL